MQHSVRLWERLCCLSARSWCETICPRQKACSCDRLLCSVCCTRANARRQIQLVRLTSPISSETPVSPVNTLAHGPLVRVWGVDGSGNALYCRPVALSVYSNSKNFICLLETSKWPIVYFFGILKLVEIAAKQKVRNCHLRLGYLNLYFFYVSL